MRSLVSYLNDKTPQERRLIGETWQANITERLDAGNAYPLAQEMESEFLQRRLLEKLTPADLEILALFLAQPDFLLDPARQPATVLEGSKLLRQSGLIYDDRAKRDPTDPPSPPPPKNRGGWDTPYNGRFRQGIEDDGLKPVWLLPRELGRPFARLVPERQNSLAGSTFGVPLSHQPLSALVARLEPEILELQAENWGVLTLVGEVEPSELARELSRALLETRPQERVRAALPEGSQNLFKTIVEQGGRTTIPALLVEYVSLRRLMRDLRPLTENLLVWEAFEDTQSLVFVPPEIAAPRSTPEPVRLPLQTVTPPNNPTPGPDYALAWDILTYINYLSLNTLDLTNNGLMPKRDLKKLLPQLWPIYLDMQEHRLEFLLKLSRQQEISVREMDRLLPGPALAEWLKLDFYEQARRCVQTWLQHSIQVGPLSLPYPYYYSKQPVITAANQKILSWLAPCEVGQWYDLNSLLQKVQREDPYFIISRQDLLNMLGPHRLTETSKLWPRLEGEIIHKTLGTALEWLGVVRVGREDNGQVTAFQLTEFGASVCGNAPQPVTPGSPRPILVQPDFEILLLTPQVETVWLLEKFTSLRKLDLVSLYSLNREALLRGLESGLSLKSLNEWLEKSNAQPLPQNLSVSLADWSKGFKQINVENVTLLEADDETVLNELLRSKQYADYFVRRISPLAAIVRLPDTQGNRRINPLKTFKASLKKGGYFSN